MHGRRVKEMETMNESVQTKSKPLAKIIEKATGTDGSKETISTFAGVSILVGLWAFCSLIGAMFMLGGPLHLVKSWFSAVTGM